MIILEPSRLAILFVGVILGLIVGVIPGLSGVVGLAILIPFTYGLDPYAAFALLIGMHAVTTNSDLIPAILFGVPGTVGAAATVVDGHAMAKKGAAGRAFGAGYADLSLAALLVRSFSPPLFLSYALSCFISVRQNFWLSRSSVFRWWLS